MKVCKHHAAWHEDEDNLEIVDDGGECVDCVRNNERKASKPSKITVNKKVFWESGGSIMTGKVKQMFSDHVTVEADGCNYVVLKGCLSTTPILRTAQAKVRLIVG